MATKKAMRLVGAVMIVIGAILLITALITPWYAFKTSFYGGSTTQSFYPGMPSTNGTIQYSCSDTPACSSQTSYNEARLNNTGTIAETGFFLLTGAIVLGVVAALFGFASRGNTRRVRPGLVFAVLTLLLAIVAPVLFAVALPGAISNDSSNFYRPANTNGPWSSFIGSSSAGSRLGTISLDWGPAIGWYLSIAAFVVVLVGLIVLFLNRKETPEPTPAPASAAPDAMPPAP
jgi:hypothetical protein